VLALLMLAELPPVHPRPLLIDASKLFPAEMKLSALGIAGGDLHMHVCIVRVSVNRGHGSRVRKALLQVVVDHFARPAVVNLLIKGIDDAIMCARFASAWLHSAELVLFGLPGVLSQVSHSLAVTDCLIVGAVNVLGYVSGPDSFLLALGGAFSGDITGVVGCRTCPPDADLDGDAHGF
jgi:citrate lyase gamma subunit